MMEVCGLWCHAGEGGVPEAEIAVKLLVCEGEDGALGCRFVQMSGTPGSGGGGERGSCCGASQKCPAGFGQGAADAVFIVGRLRRRYFRGRPGGGSC